MLQFTDPNNFTLLVVNGEGDEHLELIIGPTTAPVTTSEDGTGRWAASVRTESTEVEAPMLRAALRAAIQRSNIMGYLLPREPYAQTQLVIMPLPGSELVQMRMRAFSPSRLGPSVRIHPADVLRELFGEEMERKEPESVLLPDS